MQGSRLTVTHKQDVFYIEVTLNFADLVRIDDYRATGAGKMNGEFFFQCGEGMIDHVLLAVERVEENILVLGFVLRHAG